MVLSPLFLLLTMSASLAGRRILVTGAGRGIGRAIAQICDTEGAQVAITARTRSELEETAANTGMVVLPCDVTDSSQVESLIEQLKAKWGVLDNLTLINNAGSSQQRKGTAETLPSSDLQDLLYLNVVAVHTVTRAVLKACTPRCIVNISSRAGKMGIAGNSFYVASKFALEGYTASLALELQGKATVNTLSPGMVNTRSFPKPADRPGVRSAESIRDGLLCVLNAGDTGHYLHVDELDVVRAKGLPDTKALKPINELKFDPEALN